MLEDVYSEGPLGAAGSGGRCGEPLSGEAFL